MLSYFLNVQYLNPPPPRPDSIEAALPDKGLSTHIKKTGDKLLGACPAYGGNIVF